MLKTILHSQWKYKRRLTTSIRLLELTMRRLLYLALISMIVFLFWSASYWHEVHEYKVLNGTSTSFQIVFDRTNKRNFIGSWSAQLKPTSSKSSYVCNDDSPKFPYIMENKLPDIKDINWWFEGKCNNNLPPPGFYTLTTTWTVWVWGWFPKRHTFISNVFEVYEDSIDKARVIIKKIELLEDEVLNLQTEQTRSLSLIEEQGDIIIEQGQQLQDIVKEVGK